MAWADPLRGGGYRAGYRDSDGNKRYVKDADGRTVQYGRKSDARHAGVEAEAKARRRAAARAGVLPASMKWGEWWSILSADRTFDDTDTGRSERSIANKYLIPQWGEVPLNKIRRDDVDEWLNRGELRLRPGMSAGYAARIYGVFSVSIRAAVQRGPLDASPCAGIKLPKRPKKAKPYVSPKTAEAYRGAGRLRGDYADAVDFNLETGLRPGELCGLHADRLDLERGWLAVVEVFVGFRGVVRPYPKDGDVRMVPLTERAIEIAKRRLDGRDLSQGCGIQHTDGSPCHSPLVFRTDFGRAMTPQGLRSNMLRAAQRAKVERRTGYALRRGWATRAAEGGLDAFQIAEILGHATLTQAQEYVQQTTAARTKLSAALSRYPELMVIEGGLGQGQSGGADSGADVHKDAPRSAATRRGRGAS